MRIDAYTKVSQVYQSTAVKKAAKTNSARTSDKVEISEIGNDYNIARNAVSSAPDVRQDKVDDIKGRIQNGTYEFDMDALADKLVSD
jgi:negative regulator of flagellin synthesis FlgM